MKNLIVNTELPAYKGGTYILSTSVKFEKFNGKILAHFQYQTNSWACQGDWRQGCLSMVDYNEKEVIDYVNTIIIKENT